MLLQIVLVLLLGWEWYRLAHQAILNCASHWVFVEWALHGSMLRTKTMVDGIELTTDDMERVFYQRGHILSLEGGNFCGSLRLIAICWAAINAIGNALNSLEADTLVLRVSLIVLMIEKLFLEVVNVFHSSWFPVSSNFLHLWLFICFNDLRYGCNRSLLHLLPRFLLTLKVHRLFLVSKLISDAALILF